MAKNQTAEKKPKVVYNSDGSATVSGVKNMAEASKAVQSSIKQSQERADEIRASTKYENAVRAQKAKKYEEKKTAVDKMWERGSTTPKPADDAAAQAAHAMVAAKKNVEQKKKALSDFEESTSFDWMDATARKLYEQSAEKNKQTEQQMEAELRQAQKELSGLQIDRMPEEDKEQFRKYVESKDQKNSVFRNDISWFGDYKSQKEAENILKQKYGEEQFGMLADAYAEKIHEEEAAKAAEDAQEDTEKHPILTGLAGAPARVLGSVESVPTRIADIVTGNRNPSQYTANNYVKTYGDAVRETKAQNIESKIGGTAGKAASLAYQGVTGIADSVLRGMVGGGAVGGALLAAGDTLDQTIADAVSRGATAGQAYSLAAANAIIEYAAEKLPLDNLIEVAKGGGAKTLVANIAKQAGVEIMEEEATLAGNILLDAAIMRDKSDYNMNVAYLMTFEGLSMDEAREKALWGLVQQAGETALVSAVAGGIGGFGAAKTAAYSKEGQLDATPRNGQQQPVADVPGQDVQTDAQTKTAVMEDSIDPKSKVHTGGKVNVEEVAAELAQNAPKPEPEVKTKGQVDADNAAAKVFGVEEAKPQQNSGSTQQADTLETSALDGQTAESDTGMQSAHSGEVKKSKTFTNTGLHSADADIRAGYQQTLDQDPTAGDYQVKHNADTLATAQERTSSPEKCRAEYDYLMSKTDMWSPEDIVTAKLVSKNLMKSGDIDRVSEINIKQAQISSIMGENVQAFSIIGTMKDASDPATAVESATKGFYSMKPEDTIYNEKKVGKTFEQWRAENVRNITSIGAEIEKVADGDDKAMRGIILQLAQHRKTTGFFGLSGNMTHLANKILNKMRFDDLKIIANTQLAVMQDDFRRRTATDIALSTRKLFMLTNLKTFGRNIIGNATTGLMDSVGDSTFGQAADFLLSKITGKRTVGTDITRAKEYASAAAESAQFAALCVELDIPIETTADASFQSAIGSRESGKYIGKTFRANGNIAMRALYAYQKYMSYALEVSDKIFEGGTNAAVAESLNKLKESGLSSTEIQELAEYTGNRRTFKDATWTDADGTHGANMSRMTAAGKRLSEKYMGTPGKIVADMLMPYPKVPTNVIQTGIDYTHGVEKGIGEMISILSDVKKHKQISVARQRQAASDFGRGVTGASMLCLLTVAAAKGVIAVHDDKDKNKRALEQSEGLSGAQINWSAWQRLMKGEDTTWERDDVLSSLDAAEPFSILAYMGDELSKDDSFQDILKAYPGVSIKYTLQALMDSPYMTSISDLWDGVSEAVKAETDDERLGAAAKAASDVAGSFVPQIVRQTAQYNDGYYRDTRGVDSAEYAKNNFLSAIPGQSQNLPKKVNGLGVEQERGGWMATFFDATSTKKYKKSDVSGYLEELSERTGKTGFYPEAQAPMKITDFDGEEIVLDKGQREAYQKTYGGKVSELYQELIDYPSFSSLPDDIQMEAFEKGKELATRYAKAAVSDFRDVPDEETGELVKGLVNDSIKSGFSSAFDGLSESWKFGYGDSGARTSMEQAYSVYSSLPDDVKKAFEAEQTGQVKYYLDARQSGVSTNDFIDLYQNYREIGEMDMDTTEKAHEWAVVLEKAVDDGVITGKQKNVLREDMEFRYSMPAETVKFDTMISSGLSTDKAKHVVDLVGNVTGTGAWDDDTQKYTVRDIDVREAIATSDRLTVQEKDIAIKSYMPDYDPKAKSPQTAELKYDAIRAMGFTPEEYASSYRTYLDTSGTGKRGRVVSQYMNDYNISYSYALNLYNIFAGKYKPWAK